MTEFDCKIQFCRLHTQKRTTHRLEFYIDIRFSYHLTTIAKISSHCWLLFSDLITSLGIIIARDITTYDKSLNLLLNEKTETLKRHPLWTADVRDWYYKSLIEQWRLLDAHPGNKTVTWNVIKYKLLSYLLPIVHCMRDSRTHYVHQVFEL